MELSQIINKLRISILDIADKTNKHRLFVLKDKCSCKPGCSFCCSRMIYISVAEAVIIHEDLSKSGKWIHVRDRARKLLKYTKIANPVAWFKMNIKCPILDPDSNLCTAYNVRPVPCSIHHSTSDASGCDPWSLEPVKASIQSMDELYVEFQDKLNKTVDKYGVMNIRLPLPTAILFAERIYQQPSMKFNEILSLVYNESS